VTKFRHIPVAGRLIIVAVAVGVFAIAVVASSRRMPSTAQTMMNARTASTARPARMVTTYSNRVERSGMVTPLQGTDRIGRRQA
jgi:hypothetical protein